MVEREGLSFLGKLLNPLTPSLWPVSSTNNADASPALQEYVRISVLLGFIEIGVLRPREVK